MRVPDTSYTSYHRRGRCMSQTCLTLAFVFVPILCPRHGLILALIM
ncbi:hypothetical protein F383_17609 [Gossypium arboreum]|uniref:Uncharacterized protein n=1 Tax=Gossypium arboreum TaxID=29729 RepID=A0A0B0NNW9_GOSAR|nr:hypothetical protein F383_17609 [Gossypium arboreum]